MKKLATYVVIALSIINCNTARSVNPGKFGIDTINFAAPKGLKVGEKASNFTLSGPSGSITLYNELKKGPVVLFFYRGNWCPVCNRYLSSLNDSSQLITAEGASILAISPETMENSTLTSSNITHHNITVLSDSNNVVSEQYKVLFKVNNNYQNKINLFLFTDIAKHNGTEEAFLPIPATYVINTDGIILYRQFDYNYKNRASVKEILSALATQK